ncbi:MAG: HAMP domain-containing histidine kinase [Lachnospiraceae bacterium]|nr:HAMP domain-containing histidine kinase [Lachnospiraceae bacterium]
MIKKLRRRFIGMSMAILLSAIILVSLFVYFLAIGRINEQIDDILDLIIENEGTIPVNEEDLEDPEYDIQNGIIRLGKEMRYETRYFVVQYDDDNKMLSTDTSYIMTIRDRDARRIALKVLKKRGESGRFKDGANVYHYKKKEFTDKPNIIVFMDISSRIWMISEISLYMCMVGFIILVLFFVMLSAYSEREVRPYIENMERQKRFVTNASHELKTPLAVISANTEMIEALNGKSKWTESNIRQIERLNGLVSELVTLARLDEQDVLGSLQEVNISDITRDAVENFSQVFSSKKIAFDYYVEEGIVVMGESKTISEFVTIFLDNAAKYCDPEGVTILTLKTVKGTRCTLRISNSYKEGKNVDYSKFFERFYREDESHNSQKKGYGIGLSIAKEVVDTFKWKLNIEYLNDSIAFVISFPSLSKNQNGLRTIDKG